MTLDLLIVVPYVLLLREKFTPDVDPTLYPPFVILKSVHNVVIEAFWH